MPLGFLYGSGNWAGLVFLKRYPVQFDTRFPVTPYYVRNLE